MHNGLIFPYHRVRVPPEAGHQGAALRGEPEVFRGGSEGETQEGR